jgi:hypothetical protein
LDSFEKLCLESYGENDEEATIHYERAEGESDSDDDDESKNGQVSDAESILGSLIGSDRGSDCGSDCGDKGSDCGDLNHESDDESDTLAKSESCTAVSDNEKSEEEVDDIDFEGLTISVKAKAINYAKQVAELPQVSDETKNVVGRALSKFENPVPCPKCDKFFKNERGVKLHMSKMH